MSALKMSMKSYAGVIFLLIGYSQISIQVGFTIIDEDVRHPILVVALFVFPWIATFATVKIYRKFVRGKTHSPQKAEE